MVWNDKRPQGSGVSINYHWRSSHKRCSQFTKPVRAPRCVARGNAKSLLVLVHFVLVIWPTTAHVVYFVNQSEFKESTFMSPAPGAGNECEKVAIGLLWPIRKQVVNSVNQSEHDAKTFCWFQARENTGELWLVEKVLVARIFFKPIITRINV